MSPLNTRKIFRKACLLLAVLLLAPLAGFPSAKAGSRPKGKPAAKSSGGDKVLLSLRIAKARKEHRGIAYYTSVARQQKNRRPATARPPSSAR